MYILYIIYKCIYCSYIYCVYECVSSRVPFPCVCTLITRFMLPSLKAPRNSKVAILIFYDKIGK